MIDLLIKEPVFIDGASRMFKIPFIITESFCLDSQHIKEAFFNDDSELLQKLLSFFD